MYVSLLNKNFGSIMTNDHDTESSTTLPRTMAALNAS